MKETREKFLPGEYKVIGDELYIRRKNDGKIVMSTLENIIIFSNLENDIDIVTVSNENGLETSFFLVDNVMINAIREKSRIWIGNGFKIVNIYPQEAGCNEDVYLEYCNDEGFHGLLDMHDYGISIIIDAQKMAFTQIDYNSDDEIFYTQGPKGKKNKYYILNARGKILSIHDEPLKKVPGFENYFSRNKIDNGKISCELKEEIKNVEVYLGYCELRIYKVNTEKGDIYLDKNLNKIIGPIKESEFLLYDEAEHSNWCYIYEYEDGRTIAVHRIIEEDDVYKVKTLRSNFGIEKIIERLTTKKQVERTFIFFIAKLENGKINLFSCDLDCIYENIDRYVVDVFNFDYCFRKSVILVAYNDEKVTEICEYFSINNYKDYNITKLDFVEDGIGNQEIYKSGERFFVIDSDGTVRLWGKGDKISKRIWSYGIDVEVYLIENGNKILVYNANGDVPEII